MKHLVKLAIVVHAFSHSAQEAEAGRSLSLNLAHRVSSRTGRATQRKPVSKIPTNQPTPQKLVKLDMD